MNSDDDSSDYDQTDVDDYDHDYDSDGYASYALPNISHMDASQAIKTILNLVNIGIDIDACLDTPASRSLQQHMPRLLEFDPHWFAPLLKSFDGLRLLDSLRTLGEPDRLDGLYDAVFDYLAYNPSEALRLCYTLQSIFKSSKSQYAFVEELLLEFIGSIYEAIQYFLLPGKADAHAKIRASVLDPLPPSPQLHVPPAALPLLFPQIDTTQFAPQFDWFIYLLTQYCPTKKKKYCAALETWSKEALDPTSLYNFKPGFSLDNLLNTRLINSYEEYLHFQLPQILPQLPQQDNNNRNNNKSPDQHPALTSTSRALLFPYFPNEHPVLPSILAQAEEGEDGEEQDLSSLLSQPSEKFIEYFVYMFIFGPFMHTQTETLPPMGEAKHVPARLQLMTLHFRSWYRATTTTLSPPSASTARNNNLHHQQRQPRPPDFTANPFALFQLILLPLCPNLAMVLQPGDNPIARFKNAFMNMNLSSCAALLPLLVLPIIAHCFPNNPTARDALADEVLPLLLFHDSGARAHLSYNLYQHGRTTLHQLAHRHISNFLQNTPNPPRDPAHFIKQFICSPFERKTSNWEELSVHITLCVHAGFLTPFPLPQRPSSAPQQDSSSQEIATLVHSLTYTRSLLHSTLIRLTGLISYFPESTQLLASAISSTGQFIHLNYAQLELYENPDWLQIPLIPPHSIPDPCDSAPDLHSALVGDEGQLYAVKYTSGLGHDATSQKPSKLPIQVAPRLQNLFHDVAISDIYACVNWKPSEIAKRPQLGEGLTGDPYLRPRISSQNTAWIESEENTKALKTPETRALQKELHAYYRQVLGVETNLVVEQMQKVLLKADQAGLFDVSNAVKRKQPPPSHSSSSIAAHSHSTPSTTTTAPATTKAYPFSLPDSTLEFVIQNKAPITTNTPTLPITPKQRGVLYQDQASHDNVLYDHNYSLTTVSNTPRLDATQGSQDNSVHTKDLFDAQGRGIAEGTSMLEYARDRSEWALELLIVGCLGLHAPRPPPLQTVTFPSPPPPPPSLASPQPAAPLPDPLNPSAARIQYCKDQALSSVPRLLQSIQPTLPLATPSYATKPGPLAKTRLTYYHDTLSQVPLLSTLSLLDTLVTLPCTLPPPKASGPTQ